MVVSRSGVFRSEEYRFGGVIFSTEFGTVTSMLDACTEDLHEQEEALLSYLVARAGTFVTADALEWACALPHEGRQKISRHHLRVLVNTLRDKLDELVPGTSRHILTAFDGGGYVFAQTQEEIERLRSSGIYLTREDFARQGLR